MENKYNIVLYGNKYGSHDSIFSTLLLSFIILNNDIDKNQGHVVVGS